MLERHQIQINLRAFRKLEKKGGGGEGVSEGLPSEDRVEVGRTLGRARALVRRGPIVA